MAENKGFDWQYAVRAGLLAGLSIVYTGLIGMIAAFSERPIVTGVVTMGQLLIFAPAFLAGYVMVQHKRAELALGPGLLGLTNL